MPRIPINEVRQTLLRALEVRGLPYEHATLLADDFLGAEMEGKPTHGLGKFLLMDSLLENRGGPPQKTIDSDSFALVDARGELGQIAATESISILNHKVKQAGIAVVGMVNFSRFGRLDPYGRMIANSGLVGILMNGAGPPAVSPYDGIDPMLGTNPICFAFPTLSDPLIFDFSTGASVWGQIRQATLENRPLPDNVFLGEDGHFTTDPETAEAVIPFGGPKGYALCLAIEILSGALVSAKMGLKVESQYDIGFFAIGIDPDFFGTGDTIKKEIDEFVSAIRKSRPRDGIDTVHVPGDRSKLRRQNAEAQTLVDIADDTWIKLLKMQEGMPSGMTIK